MPNDIVAPNKEMDSSSSVPEIEQNDTTVAAPTTATAAAAAANSTSMNTCSSSSSEMEMELELEMENTDHQQEANLHPPPKQSQPHPHSLSPSPPPQTSDSDTEDNSRCEQMEMSDQIMELMRREALRHLEFAWEAERNLVLLCQDQDQQSLGLSPGLSDKIKK